MALPMMNWVLHGRVVPHILLPDSFIGLNLAYTDFAIALLWVGAIPYYHVAHAGSLFA